MNTASYQLALLIGMGTLATLLIRGMSLMTAVYRSVVVVLIMLGLLIVAGFIVSWATARHQPISDFEGSSTELEQVEEPE
ncbi:MAG: hypothetical protein V3W14_13995 [Candidatus Neomarinimicrobiota bacterium]